MRKKRLLFQSDFALANTGFGRNTKALLDYLYKTGKYEICNYCCGANAGVAELNRTPWKSVGCIPTNAQEIENLKKDPNAMRLASYGSIYLDQVVCDFKPDVYLAVQDIWGIDFALGRFWMKDTTPVFWTTLDSLPILPTATSAAKKIKDFWVWADFARQAMHKDGLTNVKTVHGAIDHTKFHRLPDKARLSLRQQFNINPNDFIIGFVFRNQLRKSVPNLLEGFSLFKSSPETKNAKLLLHTSWNEGWNIHKLAAEYNIPKTDILTTFICRTCGKFEVKPLLTPECDCRFCGTPKAQITTNPSIGITEKQLNEVYNLMDVYCHPFTSGGQEIPIQEAKLAELITLVTNYSCGEDCCVEEAASLPLTWSSYREHGTEFIKASTNPFSIEKQLKKVFEMKPSVRAEMGKKAREWTIKNFSVETIGKILMEFIDNAPFSTGSFKHEFEDRDPYFQVPDIQNDSDWVKCLYHNILKARHVEPDDEGHKYWMSELKKGTSRRDIENYFRNVAMQENQQNKKVDFNTLLDPNDKGRVLFVMPESAGDIFLCTSLFESIKKRYPDWSLYVATQPPYKDIVAGNPYVHRWLQYHPAMESSPWLEGHKGHDGFFDVAYLPHIQTQRILHYWHNGKDVIDFPLDGNVKTNI